MGTVIVTMAMGKVFSKLLGFLANQSFIPPTAPQSSSYLILGWYNSPINGPGTNGLGSTPDKEIIIRVFTNGKLNFFL
jgi:hypothetical protein